MNKNSLMIALYLFCATLSQAFAAETIQIKAHTSNQRAVSSPPLNPDYHVKSQHYNKRTNKTTTTYQQMYHGVPVLGGQVTTSISGKLSRDNNPQSINLRDLQQIPEIRGKAITQIELDPDSIALYQDPTVLQNSLETAMQRFNRTPGLDNVWKLKPAKSELVIAIDNGEAKLIHRVSFYAKAKKQPKRLVTLLVDAKQPERVYKIYDALQHSQSNHAQVAPGGNTKTGKYVYGESGLPELNVNRVGKQCYMRNKKIKVVNAFEHPEREDYHHSIKYTCGDTSFDEHCTCTSSPWWKPTYTMFQNFKKMHETQEALQDWLDNHFSTSDPDANVLLQQLLKDSDKLEAALEGQSEFCYCGYSSANDAYYFGQTVYDMFQDWYQTKVLQERLTLRVHVVDYDMYAENGNRNFANAYWDPEHKTMNFGDGHVGEMYPLVTLDVTGHEVAHGFTEEHSGLSYFDQTGSLNESFSDMAGIATLEFMRQNQPALYRAIYHTDNLVWTIGPTVKVTPWDHLHTAEDKAYSFDYPIRYTDSPSDDGLSADCFNPVDGCVITYADMKQQAYKMVEVYASLYCDADLYDLCVEMLANNIIVHSGSGIFNKAFYLLANKDNWDVKKAFEVMLTANRDGYWLDRDLFNQEGFMQEAACATVVASHDLGYEATDVMDAFQQVGLLTDNSCEINHS